MAASVAPRRCRGIDAPLRPGTAKIGGMTNVNSPLQAQVVQWLVAPGDGIVLVITASSHRVAAFEAASFLMDYLKTRAPFWKREHLTDGTTGGWVEATEADDAAAARWA